MRVERCWLRVESLRKFKSLEFLRFQRWLFRRAHIHVLRLSTLSFQLFFDA
jgi:hypothetical protein